MDERSNILSWRASGDKAKAVTSSPTRRHLQNGPDTQDLVGANHFPRSSRTEGIGRLSNGEGLAVLEDPALISRLVPSMSASGPSTYQSHRSAVPPAMDVSRDPHGAYHISLSEAEKVLTRPYKRTFDHGRAANEQLPVRLGHLVGSGTHPSQSSGRSTTELKSQSSSHTSTNQEAVKVYAKGRAMSRQTAGEKESQIEAQLDWLFPQPYTSSQSDQSLRQHHQIPDKTLVSPISSKASSSHGEVNKPYADIYQPPSSSAPPGPYMQRWPVVDSQSRGDLPKQFPSGIGQGRHLLDEQEQTKHTHAHPSPMAIANGACENGKGNTSRDKNSLFGMRDLNSPAWRNSTQIRPQTGTEMAVNKGKASEVIDLTEDGPLPSANRIRNSSNNGPVASQNAVADYGGSELNPRRTATWKTQPPPQTDKLIPPPSSTPHREPSREDESSSSSRNSVDIVKRIDPSTAIRRSEYNPNTIARDVLRAVGLHPSEKGLNAHLEVLKSRFKEVDDTSDLSTLRSDLIDVPQGGAPESVNMASVDGSMKGVSQKTPVHSAIKPPRGGFSSAPHGASRLSTSIPSRPSLLRNATTPGSQSRSFAVVITSTPPKGPVFNPRVSGLIGSDDGEGGGPASSGSSASTPRISRPRKNPTPTTVEQPSLTPKKRLRPPKISETTPAPEPARKKIGRPFKTPEAAAAAASKGQSTKKRRARTVKLPEPESDDETPPPERKFIPFLCEWKECPAELHNLETLRAHLFNVHKKREHSGKLPCLWGNCSTIRKVADSASKSSKLVDKAFTFKSEEEWRDHINKAHLIPLAWHMGDGPRGTSLGRSLLLFSLFQAI